MGAHLSRGPGDDQGGVDEELAPDRAALIAHRIDPAEEARTGAGEVALGVFLVFARTDPATRNARGISAFIVDRDQMTVSLTGFALHEG